LQVRESVGIGGDNVKITVPPGPHTPSCALPAQPWVLYVGVRDINARAPR
jgi:hypothetical protein